MAKSIIVDVSESDNLIKAVDQKIEEVVARHNAKRTLAFLMPLIRTQVEHEKIIHDEKWLRSLD